MRQGRKLELSDGFGDRLSFVHLLSLLVVLALSQQLQTRGIEP